MSMVVTMNPMWSEQILIGIKSANLEMATDIHRRAVLLGPVLSRALVNSGVIEAIPDGFRIKFGSSRVPYARKRHFENKKNPQTLGYLAKAGESVARSDKSKYFRGKV